MFHNGMSNNDRDFEVCMRVENVILPKNGFFGISAATGGLAGKSAKYEYTLIRIVNEFQFGKCKAMAPDDQVAVYSENVKDNWIRVFLRISVCV